MYTRPSKAEQCLHNVLKVVEALRHIGLDYDIQVSLHKSVHEEQSKHIKHSCYVLLSKQQTTHFTCYAEVLAFVMFRQRAAANISKKLIAGTREASGKRRQNPKSASSL